MLQTPLQPKLLGSTAGRAVSMDVGSGGVVTGMLDANGILEGAGSSREEVHCGFCKTIVVGNVVACSGCNGCFHTDKACLGVDVEVVSCPVRVRSGALQYRCCRCRSGIAGASGVASGHSGMLPAFEQLFNVVYVLSKRVCEMRDRIKETSHHFESQSTSDMKIGIASREAMHMELK